MADDVLAVEQLARQASARTDRALVARRALRQVVVFVVFLLLLALGYTGYKAAGQAIDDAQTDWPVVGSVLPRSDDLNMPPVADIVSEIGATQRGTDKPLGRFVLNEAAFTLREAAVGFVAGVALGLGIAIALTRSRRLEQGVLPYVIATQTVPLVAVAPIVVIWGRGNFDFLPWEWQDWMSVSIIASFLSFFPVAVNGLRGLQSPKPEHMELMESYAAGWAQTVWRVRLPASVPYLFAAFKLAATASVVGAIVGEISAGVAGGLGRRVLLEAQRYTTGPERLYVAVIGSAALGIFVFLLITGVERTVLSRQGREAIS